MRTPILRLVVAFMLCATVGLAQQPPPLTQTPQATFRATLTEYYSQQHTPDCRAYFFLAAR